MKDAERFDPLTRWLTPASKESVLSDWERTKSEWRSGALSGVGAPDGDIVPWCDLINALPGICTLQSCAGHRRGKMLSSAHVWLWLSREAQRRFDQNAFVLLRSDMVDWVSTHHQADGKQIASITFYGNERAMFGQSILFVYGFLCGIADPASS
jgi:hypothetical protein